MWWRGLKLVCVVFGGIQQMSHALPNFALGPVGNRGTPGRHGDGPSRFAPLKVTERAHTLKFRIFENTRTARI